MNKVKELLSQAYNQLDEYNKGGATLHNLLLKAMRSGNTIFYKAKAQKKSMRLRGVKKEVSSLKEQ